MALENSISGGGKANFRRSMTFQAEEHVSSIGRSLNFVSGKNKSELKKRKKQHSRSGSNADKSHTEAEIKHLKFKTELPDRIIRQSLAVFDEFDINSNGVIVKGEIRDTLNAMGISVNDAQLKRLMEAFDENQDTEISKEEFLKVVRKIGLYHQRDDIEENDKETENIMCAFVALGGNSDFTGTVSCAKLKDMVNAFDLDLDVDALLALLDDDDGGTVDYAEFSALFSSNKVERDIVQEMVNIIDEDDEDIHDME